MADFSRMQSLIGKSWNSWNLPEGAIENDLQIMRALYKPKETKIPLEQKNPLPNNLMYLYGSRPEYDWFSLTQCPACKKFYKSQWLNNHYIKNAANEFLCRKTDIVVGLCRQVVKKHKGPRFLTTHRHHQTKTKQNSSRHQENSKREKQDLTANSKAKRALYGTHWSDKHKKSEINSQHKEKENEVISASSKKSSKSKMVSSSKQQSNKTSSKTFPSATYTLSIPNDDRDGNPLVDMVVVSSKSRKSSDVKSRGLSSSEKLIKSTAEHEGLKSVHDNVSSDSKRKSSHASVKVSKTKTKHGTKHESRHGKVKSSENHKENYKTTPPEKFKIPLKSKSSTTTSKLSSLDESKDLVRKEFTKLNYDFNNDESYIQRTKDTSVAAKVVYRSSNSFPLTGSTFGSPKISLLDTQSNIKSLLTSKAPVSPSKLPLVPKSQSKVTKSPNQSSDHHQQSVKHSSSKHQSSPKQSSKVNSQKSVFANTKPTLPLLDGKNQTQHKTPVVAVSKTVSQTSTSKPKLSSVAIEKSSVTSKSLLAKSPTAISSKESQSQSLKTSSKSSKSSKSSSSSTKSQVSNSSNNKSSPSASEKSSSASSKTSSSKSTGSSKSHSVTSKSLPSVVSSDLLNVSKWSSSASANTTVQPSSKQQTSSHYNSEDYNVLKTKYGTPSLDIISSSKTPVPSNIKSPESHVPMSTKEKKHFKSHSPSTSEITSSSGSSKHSVVTNNLYSPEKKQPSKHVSSSASETTASVMQQKGTISKDKKLSSKSSLNSTENKLYHPVPIKCAPTQSYRDTSSVSAVSAAEDIKLIAAITHHINAGVTTVPPPYTAHKALQTKSSNTVKTSFHNASTSTKTAASSQKPSSTDESRVVTLKDITPNAQTPLVSVAVETPITKLEPAQMIPGSVASINQGTPLPVAAAQNTVDVKPPPKKKKKKKDKLEPRRVIPLKDRCFNPDQHCGVVVSPNLNPCKRSLTCKTHSIILRRAVIGRSNGFDSLLAAHKKARDEERNAKILTDRKEDAAVGVKGGANINLRPPHVQILNAAGVPIAVDPVSKRPISLSEIKPDGKGGEPGIEVIDLVSEVEALPPQKCISVIPETAETFGRSYCDLVDDGDLEVEVEEKEILLRRLTNKWRNRRKRKPADGSTENVPNKKRQRMGRTNVSKDNILKSFGQSLNGNPTFTIHSVKNRLAARRNAAVVHMLLAKRYVDQKRNAVFKQTRKAKRALAAKDIENARKYLTVRNIMLADDPLLTKQNKLAKGLCNLTLCRKLAMKLPFFARRPQFIEKYLADRKYFLSKQYIILQQQWQLRERLKVRKRMLSCLRLAMKRLLVHKYQSGDKRKILPTKLIAKRFKVNTYRSLRQLHVLKITKQTEKKKSERSKRFRRTSQILQLRNERKKQLLLQRNSIINKAKQTPSKPAASPKDQSTVRQTTFIASSLSNANVKNSENQKVPVNVATKASVNIKDQTINAAKNAEIKKWPPQVTLTTLQSQKSLSNVTGTTEIKKGLPNLTMIPDGKRGQCNVVTKGSENKQGPSTTPIFVAKSSENKTGPSTTPIVVTKVSGNKTGPSITPIVVTKGSGIKQGPSTTPIFVAKNSENKTGPYTTPIVVAKGLGNKQGPSTTPIFVAKSSENKTGPPTTPIAITKTSENKKGPSTTPIFVAKSSESKIGPSTTPIVVSKNLPKKSKPGTESNNVKPDFSLKHDSYRQVFSHANSGKHSVVNYLTGKGFKLMGDKVEVAQDKTANESVPTNVDKGQINQTVENKPKYVSNLLNVHKLIEQKLTAKEKISNKESFLVRRYLASQSTKDKNRILSKCLLAKSPVQTNKLASKVRESSKTLVFSSRL